MDLYAYYNNSSIDEDPNVHVKITDANFNWGKSVNTNVSAKSTVHPRKTRDKGKRKKVQSEDAEAGRNMEGDAERREFYLSNINLNVKRVS